MEVLEERLKKLEKAVGSHREESQQQIQNDNNVNNSSFKENTDKSSNNENFTLSLSERIKEMKKKLTVFESLPNFNPALKFCL